MKNRKAQVQFLMNPYVAIASVVILMISAPAIQQSYENFKQGGRVDVPSEVQESSLLERAKNIKLTPHVTDEGVDLCKTIEEFELEGQLACQYTGGSWICSEDKIGCVGFSVDQEIQCQSQIANMVKQECSKFGGKFTCNQEEVSCTN